MCVRYLLMFVRYAVLKLKQHKYLHKR